MEPWRPTQPAGPVPPTHGGPGRATSSAAPGPGNTPSSGSGARATTIAASSLPRVDLCEVLIASPTDGLGEGEGQGEGAGSRCGSGTAALRREPAAAAAVAIPACASLPIARSGSAQSAGPDVSAGAAAVLDVLDVRQRTTGIALLDESAPAADERTALLGAWRRSDDSSAKNGGGDGSSTHGGVRGKEPYGSAGLTRRPVAAVTASGRVSSNGASGVAAGAGRGGDPSVTAAAAAGRGGGRFFSPFEVSGQLLSAAAAVAPPAPQRLTPAAGSLGCPSRGGVRSSQIERTPSTLLSAATLAGDLHTAVPAPVPSVAAAAVGSGSNSAAAAAAAIAGISSGGGGGARSSGVSGGGLSGGGGGSGALSTESLGDDNAKFSEYMRDEQIRHAAEAHRAAVRLSHTALKRAFMLAVTAGFLGAAIYLSRIPWGQRETSGLPTWRWFLIVGCLPSVWYIPWYAIFLLVLLLESLLPVAIYSSMAAAGPGAGGGRYSSRSAVAAQVAGGGGGGGGGGGSGEDPGGGLVGPALLIYHILGIRRHMVRVLRSLSGQLLVHFAVVDYLEPAAKSREADVMKAWTCLTLFLTANTLKSLVAKALSKHFHSRGYLQRMQQAVKQELVLMALSRPRPGRARGDALTHLGLSYHLANIFGYTGNGATSISTSASGGRKAFAEDRGGGSGSGVGGGGGGGSALTRSPFAAPANGGAGAGGGRTGVREELTVTSASAVEAPAPPAAQLAPGAGRRRMQRISHSVCDLATLVAEGQQQQQQLLLQPHQPHPASQLQPRQGQGLTRQSEPTSGSVRTLDGLPSAGWAGGDRSRGPAAAGDRGGGGGGGEQRRLWRAFWAHLRSTYAKTAVQWELSRPSGSSRKPPAGAAASRGGLGAAGGGGATRGDGSAHGGGGGGVSAGGGSAGSGSGGGLVHSDGLNFEQLRTSLFWLEQHIRRNKLQMGVTLSDQLRAAAEGSEVASKTEAKRLAFYLHLNVLGLSDLKGRKYLVARDFEPFFNSAAEVREAFAMFDSDHDGRITLQNMVDTIVRVYKERKKLSLTLQDTRTVVAKLELICGVVVHVIFACIYLTIFQVSVKELWFSFSSIILGFVFVFGNSIRSIYEAVLFLFVVHPFDVGDWLLLASGEVVKVEEIALLFCTFVKGDGRRLYYPNPKLIQEPVVNISRSGTYYDSATLLVDLATPGSVLEAVEGRLKRWLSDNPQHFTGSGGVTAKALANPSKLQLNVVWEYCHNGEDQGRTARWRSKTLLVLTAALESLGASYTFPAIRGTGQPAGEAAAVMGLLNGDESTAARLVGKAQEAAGPGVVELAAGAAVGAAAFI